MLTVDDCDVILWPTLTQKGGSDIRDSGTMPVSKGSAVCRGVKTTVFCVCPNCEWVTTTLWFLSLSLVSSPMLVLLDQRRSAPWAHLRAASGCQYITGLTQRCRKPHIHAYLQFRILQLVLWHENQSTKENPSQYRENIQTAHRKNPAGQVFVVYVVQFSTSVIVKERNEYYK